MGTLVELLIALVGFYLAIVVFLGWAMYQSPERFAWVISFMPSWGYLIVPFDTMFGYIRSGKLRPGDPAPDFSLQTLDGNRRVTLSSLREAKRPVVLVFGSYT